MPALQNARPSGLKLKVAAIWLACMMTLSVALGTMCAPPYSTASGAPADSTTVCFTYAQADSLLRLIDGQQHSLTMLQIDLWEAQQLALADSMFAAERARIMQRHYQALLDRQSNWFERAMKHPMVWFVLGTYLGVRASELP